MTSAIQAASIWEDGLRTDPQKKSFEWWYFDSQLDDGSTVVVTFYTKSPSRASGPPQPAVEITHTTPNGKKHYFTKNYSYTDFSAAKEKCNVKIGPNIFSGDLKKYRIHIELPEITAEIELDGIAPSYHTASPESGKPEYFGWFSAVPYGKVKLELKYQDFEKKLTGTGYHDHNWGIINIREACDYWYWGRGHAGDYSIIYAVMYLPKILGGQHASVFYLAKGGTIIAESSNHLEVTEIDISPPKPKPGHLPTRIGFTFKDGEQLVTFTLTKPHLIESKDPLSDEPGWKKAITRMFFQPLYVRYTCDLDMEIVNGHHKDHVRGTSIYEIMILK